MSNESVLCQGPCLRNKYRFEASYFETARIVTSATSQAEPHASTSAVMLPVVYEVEKHVAVSHICWCWVSAHQNLRSIQEHKM